MISKLLLLLVLFSATFSPVLGDVCSVWDAQIPAPSQIDGHKFHNLSLVDVRKTALSCVDGRSDYSVIATPGGDAGEFLLGVAALSALLDENSLPPLSQLDVELLFAGLASHVATEVDASRPFYMHTDAHKVEAVMEELGLPAMTEIEDIPENRRDEALTLLQEANFTGCGHIKLQLTYPSEYGVDATLVQAFLRSFYRTLWEDHDYAPSEPRAAMQLHVDDVVTLEGDHEEKCILVLQHSGNIYGLHPDDEVCENYEVSVVPLAINEIMLDNVSETEKSCFVLHASNNNATGADFFRDTISVYFHLYMSTLLAATDGQELFTYFTRSDLRDRIQTLAASQLASTVSYLAPTLPQYTVSYETYYSSAGVLVASAFASVLVAFAAAVVF